MASREGRLSGQPRTIKVMTHVQLAAEWNESERWVRDKCRSGEIPCRKLGDGYLISEDQLEEWVRNGNTTTGRAVASPLPPQERQTADMAQPEERGGCGNTESPISRIPTEALAGSPLFDQTRHH